MYRATVVTVASMFTEDPIYYFAFGGGGWVIAWIFSNIIRNVINGMADEDPPRARLLRR